MTAILLDDGDLLVPLGACVAAERIHTGDPRYSTLLEGAVPASDLCGTPADDAALAARFELNHQARQARSA